MSGLPKLLPHAVTAYLRVPPYDDVAGLLLFILLCF
jgi:hypothetical protein